MSGRDLARRLIPLLIAALGGVLVYSLFSDDDDPDRAAAGPERSNATTSTSPARLIASLPDIGRLTWRCDDSERFSTTLRIRDATVFVTTVSDGKRLWRQKQVDPVPPQSGRLTTPFEHVRRQIWRIRFHHKPASLDATVRIRFAVSRIGDCYTPRVKTDTRTDAHDR